ncbi:hypothetical protein U27_06771 [Candidatus Vecturithrix granuli]|uniref:Uncharacterized protein n=1 Tax=Vecturithrix granuli TaxID=1499967 RepID=A0A081C5D1_VECG1|nr:hypothetical protein U27_06771 [Candidatus Vecturithrix granuli]
MPGKNAQQKKKKMLHFVICFDTIAAKERVDRENLPVRPIRNVNLTMGMNRP